MNRNTVLFHSGFWLMVFSIQVFLTIRLMSTGDSILRSLFATFILATVFYLNVHFVNTLYENGKKRQYLLAAFFILLIAPPIRALFDGLVLDRAIPQVSDPSNIKTGSFFFMSTLLDVLLSFYYQHNSNQLAEKKRLEDTVAKQNQAQLDYLKGQLNPHFLFNSLNNIYSLTQLDADKSADMVLRLSGILRYTLYRSDNDHVSISEEIEQIENLIALNEVRSDAELNIQLKTELASADQPIEPMLLLPIVENCLKHGDILENDEGFVMMELNSNTERLSFIVINSIGNLNQEPKKESGGLGLKNLKQRLELIYPDRFDLITELTENTYRTELHLRWKS